MLKGPLPASPPQEWSETELSLIEAYACGSDGQPPTPCALALPAPIGHNNGPALTTITVVSSLAVAAVLQPISRSKVDFKAAIAENLRGLYIAQRNTLVRAIRDPVLGERHRVILAEIIMQANVTTGAAHPGYRGLAEATGYSEATVELTITELLRWGYLASTRKAAEPGGRALAHYTVIKPTREQLEAAIAAHVLTLRREKPDPNPAIRNSSDPNPAIRNAVPNPSVMVSLPVPNTPPLKTGSVPNPVLGTVTRREATRRERGADAPPSPELPVKSARPPKASAAEVDQAIELYNEAARQHGYTVCHSRPETRLARLQRRLREIGGLEPFRRALSAIQLDDFLAGRVRPRDGRHPFKLDLDRLLQTDGTLGDVLAKLIDRAGDAAPAGNGTLPDLRDNLPLSKKVLQNVSPHQPWPPAMGPPPGSKECRFHHDALRELGFLPGRTGA